jgi:hypothetical protein
MLLKKVPLISILFVIFIDIFLLSIDFCLRERQN